MLASLALGCKHEMRVQTGVLGANTLKQIKLCRPCGWTARSLATETSKVSSTTQPLHVTNSLPNNSPLYHKHYGPVLGPYGLRRIDYSVPPVPWPTPPLPPANIRTGAYVLWFVTGGAAIYTYLHQEDDAAGFWTRIYEPIGAAPEETKSRREGDHEDGEFVVEIKDLK